MQQHDETALTTTDTAFRNSRIYCNKFIDFERFSVAPSKAVLNENIAHYNVIYRKIGIVHYNAVVQHQNEYSWKASNA